MYRTLNINILSVYKKGLVDCETAQQFNESYNVLAITWHKEFVKWMETTKFRVRSLKLTTKKCMLRELRVAVVLEILQING